MAERKARKKAEPRARPLKEPRHPTFSIGAHVLGIRKSRQTKHQRLGAFDGRRDFGDWFYTICQQVQAAQLPADDGSEAWRIGELERRSTGVICGTIESGDSGYASHIVDRESGASIYRRKPSDADLIPMFFMVEAPPDSDTAIIILQKHGIRSPFSFFKKALRQTLRQFHGNEYLIELKPYVTQATLNMFRGAPLQRVVFATTEVPSDYFDFMKLGSATRAHFEHVVKFEDPIGLPGKFLSYFRKGNAPSAGDLPDGVTDVKITVKLSGKERTLVLGRAEDMVPYIEIPPGSVRARDGHPIYEEMVRYALTYLDEVSTEVRGEPSGEE